MKKHILTLLSMLVLFAVMSVTAVYAQYTYRASYTISENGTASYDMLPVWVASNNQWMIDNGFIINADALDTRIETLGGLVRPHSMTDNMTLTAVAVPTNSQTNLYFTTGNSLLSDFDIIVGIGGNITTADNITIELGDNFTSEFGNVWIDTTAVDNYLVRKHKAFWTYVSASGNVTAGMPSDSSDTASYNATANSGPNEHSTTGGDAWQVVSDGSDATYLQVGASSTKEDAFTNGAVYSDRNPNDVINSVTVYFRARENIPNGWGKATIWIDGNPYRGGVEDYSNVFAWYSHPWATNPATGDPWEVSELEDLEFGIQQGTGVGVTCYCTELYIVINYNAPTEVTATGVTSDEHTVITRANGTLLELLVDTENLLWNSDFEVGDPPTGWTLTGTNAIFERSTAQVNIGTYSGNLTRTTATAQIGQQIPDYASCIGQEVTFGCWIRASVPDRARIRIYDGQGMTYSNFHVGDSNFAWHTVTRTIDALANRVEVDCRVEGGATTGYFDGAILVEGSTVPQTPPVPVTTTLSANVTDNANDWVFMSDATPYTESISISVNGTQALLYEPITYITGTNLPDLAGTSQDGTITWGTNPTGVTVALGSMVSSSQPTPGEAISEPTQDILPGVEVTDWFLPPDISGVLLTNPMRPFVTLMSDTTTLTEIQSWRLLAFAFVLLVTLTTARGVRGHHLITGIGCGASWGGMVALTIFPMWSLVFMILPIVAGAIAERSPSL